LLTKPKRLKPGPKANANLRHKKAALYFCSVAHDEGWTCEDISRLCKALYGVGVTPAQIAHWADIHERAAQKIKEAEIRVTNDLGV
jgi:hypothetical protein